MNILKEHGSFSDRNGGQFVIAELNPEAMTFDHADPAFYPGFHYAQEVGRVVRASWTKKFVHPPRPSSASMTPTELNSFLPDVYRQHAEIARPARAARYLLALAGAATDELTFSAQAVTRVETYKSRNPLDRRPYPNVSDLETLNGEISKSTLYGPQAAALLYFALREHPSDVKVSTYTEEPNFDGIAFYESIGFSPRKVVPEVKLPFSYVHMEAPDNATVQRRLEREYDFLSH